MNTVLKNLKNLKNTGLAILATVLFCGGMLIQAHRDSGMIEGAILIGVEADQACASGNDKICQDLLTIANEVDPSSGPAVLPQTQQTPNGGVQ